MQLARTPRMLLAAVTVTIALGATSLAVARASADQPRLTPLAVAPPQSVRAGVELSEVRHAPPPRPPVESVHQPRTRRVAEPRRPAPSRILTINVIASVPIAQGASWVNRCAGPVEVNFPGIPPQIVQHDYCGGLWVLGLRTGERIRFIGAVQGVYLVNGQRRTVHTGDNDTLAGGLGDLVAQTCIPGQYHAIQWVGLTRLGA